MPARETGKIVIRCKCGVRMQDYCDDLETTTAKTLRCVDLYSRDAGCLDE